MYEIVAGLRQPCVTLHTNNFMLEANVKLREGDATQLLSDKNATGIHSFQLIAGAIMSPVRLGPDDSCHTPMVSRASMIENEGSSETSYFEFMLGLYHRCRRHDDGVDPKVEISR